MQSKLCGGFTTSNVILSGIAKGLNFLHGTLGLAHNDINLANIILYDKGHSVINDLTLVQL